MWVVFAGLALAGPPVWEVVRVPNLEAPVEGTTGLDAASCGSCHAEIYAEWKASVHAHAWVDRQFQAELHKDPVVGWVCLNCHTPMAGQQAEITATTGDVRAPVRTPNASFDAALRDEGITCLACHWAPEGVRAPHEGVLAPHPTVHDPGLQEAVFCESCHQAVARYEDALVCTFDTGAEVRAAGGGKTCQECHMPSVERAVAAGAPVRATRRHLWMGSLIPKDEILPEEQAFYDMFESAVDVVASLDGSRAWFWLTNARALHPVPTGDPERFLLVVVEVSDKKGAIVARHTERIGQVWEWHPVARRISDNRLQPGETRALAIPVEVPRGGVVRWRLESHRISAESAAYHHLDGYPTHRVVAEGTL